MLDPETTGLKSPVESVEVAVVDANAKIPVNSFSRSRFAAPVRKRGPSPRPGHYPVTYPHPVGRGPGRFVCARTEGPS